MKKYIQKRRNNLVSTLATLLVLLLVGVVFVSNTKETYAIDTGVFKNGFPTTTFKPGTSTDIIKIIIKTLMFELIM